MLHCRGGAFYTGHTDNLEHRLAEHQGGFVAGFTSGLLPVELVWSEEFPTRIEALDAERRIKGWSRKEKLALIRGDWDQISHLAKSKSCPLRLAGQASRSGQASTSSGRTEVNILKDVFAALLWEAANAAPNEACGLLLGDGRYITQILPASNVAAEPECNFEIDPRVLIDAHCAAREGGRQVVGYYHSHPAGVARPSATDREMAAHDGRVWAVVAGGEVRFWLDAANRFEPLSYRLVDG